MTMSYILPGIVGTLITALVFIGLAVFVFLQRSKSPKLGKLLFVAIGLGLLGVVPVLAVPLNLVEGFVGYGGVVHLAVDLIGDIITGLGYYVGVAGVVAGFTLTAVDLANGVKEPGAPQAD